MPGPRVSLSMLATVVGLAAAAAAPSAATPAGVSAPVSMDALDTGVIQQVNVIRRQHGLPAVRLNQSLPEAASSHSGGMGSDGYFDHASFDGTAFWKRIGRWY